MKKLNVGEILKLDDGIDYVIMSKINYNNKEYVLFTNLDNSEDIMIKTEIIKDDEIYLDGLDNAEEFDLALKLFGESLSIS